MEKERKWICAAVAILIAGIVTGMTIYRQSVLVEAKVEKTQEKLAYESSNVRSGQKKFSGFTFWPTATVRKTSS